MRTSGRREEAGFGAREKVSQGREPPGGNKHEETGRYPKRVFVQAALKTAWV